VGPAAGEVGTRGTPQRREKNVKPITAVAVALFGLIALVQLLRVILGWEVTVNGMVVPIWASAAACVVAAALAVLLWRESRTGPGRR